MQVSTKAYEHLSHLVYEKFGIALGKNKQALVVTRLEPTIRKLGFKNFEEYYHHVIQDSSGKSLLVLANQITTNYSFFYRETDHFDFLSQVALPQKIKQIPSYNNDTLNIWSAACSSGEEPYTIAMVLHEFFETNNTYKWNTGILATDIDTNMLQYATTAIYPENRLKNVPFSTKLHHFKKLKNDEWQVKEHIKKYIHFSRYNLMKNKFEFKSKFFIIFCRNVMIYFDKKTVQELVERFYEFTEQGGYLIIGQTETLDKSQCPYKYVAPSVYQKI